MNLRFLILLIVFFATNAYAVDLSPIEKEAIRFVTRLDRYMASKDKEEGYALFRDGFKYEGCDGTLNNWDVYSDVLFRLRGPGVLKAIRFDQRDYVAILQIQYGRRRHEIMLRRELYRGFALERAQEIIC